MDPNFAGAADNFINGYNYGEEESRLFSDSTNWDLYQQSGHLLDTDSLGFALNTNPIEGSTGSMPVTDPSMEDTDFSETIKFIGQVLMEENVEQRPYYDPLSLQVTEKSFYHALIDKIPLSPNQHPLLDTHSSDAGNGTTSINNSNSSFENFLHENFRESNSNSSNSNPDTPDSVLGNHAAFQFNSHAISHTSSQPPSTDGLIDLDSSITKLLAQNIFSDADSVSQFKRGLEEANKFLPPQPRLLTGLEPSNSDVVPENSFGLKGRKNHNREESDVREGRSNKQSALGVVVDEEDLSEMFDKVLLNVEHVCLKTEQPPSSSEGGKKGQGRSKKQGKKKETIDLRTLLLLCSQAVYTNDNRTANELLKQIRQHSSPFGDASQRLAHYFANGLQERLVGDGTDAAQTFFTSPSSKRITAAKFLKAYQLHLSTIPYKKFAYLFANKMIYKAAEKAETLHIIDFGIIYGFQWPILIKFLSNREGGPPKLRITGIEFPLPGFRPTERNEETGRRLASYCMRFGVPFEYNTIASRNWETIKVEDLKIDSNEVVAVNCMMRFKNLLDETIEVKKSPRNGVLHLIRKINPDIFTHSIVNGSYNSPFFATRYREALFHFSTICDMFDTVIPRESEWRMMIERESVGREAMNVIACEGFERVERPETYKQWQVRITRAGFTQLPLDSELMNKFKTKLREWYHKDFVFDEDNNWMLQGWKGRILYASTCWVPAVKNSYSRNQHKNLL